MKKTFFRKTVSLLLTGAMVVGSTNFFSPITDVMANENGEVVYTLPERYNDDNPITFDLSSNGASSYSILTDELDVVNASIDMRLKHTGSRTTKYSNVILGYSDGTYGSLRFKTSPEKEKYIGGIQFTMESNVPSATAGSISSSSPIYVGESDAIKVINSTGSYNDYTLTVLNQNDGTALVSIKINGNVPSSTSESLLTLPTDATLQSIGVHNDTNPISLSYLEVTDLDGTTELPDVPTNLSASSTVDGKINLSWDSMENARSYNVLVADGTNEYVINSNTNEIQLESLGENAKLINGNTYSFAVQSVGRSGASAYTTDSVNTKLTLAKVENLKVTQHIGKVTLEWDEVNGATNYKIYLDNKEVKEVTNTTTDIILSDEEIHDFKVMSLNNAGESDEGYSATVTSNALPITEKPGIPTKLEATVGNGKVTLRWEQSIYANSYVVYKDNEVVDEVSANELSYIVENLENEKEYTFQVSAKNNVGESDKSEAVKATPIQVANPLNLVEGAWLETAYATWNAYPNATGYNAYWKEASANDSSYVKVDDELVRSRRVDILGLKGNVEYTIKVVAVVGDEEDQDSSSLVNVIPVPHERSGFAFAPQSPLGTANGGYNDDGTVKENANIIYVSEETKNTVKLVDGGVTYTGLKEIFPSGAKSKITQPLIVRFIGNVSTPEGLSDEHSLDVKETKDITFEGVGSDAVVDGYGITSNKSTNVVIRNLTFSGFIEDAVSIKGPSTNNWVSNNTFLIGAAGSGDKAKGDGSTDTKDGATYFTVSYNHYIESGKAQLAGATPREGPYSASYHHNWYDNSGSRHPRVRAGSVHVYNNFYSGVTTYGVGASINSSVFVENNYFENTKLPMIMSGQGHSLKDGYTGTGPLGGTGNEDMLSGEGKAALRQRGNYLDEYSLSWFDEEYDTGDSKNSSHVHNMFHENINTFYTYAIQTPEAARESVMKYAGVLNTPDFSVPPTTPENLSATLNEDLTFTLTWDLQSGAKKYELALSEDDGATYKTLATTESIRYTTSEKAEVGKTYLFKVRGLNDAGESNYSKPSKVAYVPPSTPTNLVVVEQPGGFSLTWTASENASSYDITISNENFSQVYNEQKNSFSTNELETGEYNISIVAKNGDLASAPLTGTGNVLGLIKKDDLNKIVWEEDFESNRAEDTVNPEFNPSETIGSGATYNAVEYTSTTDKGMGLKLIDKSNGAEDRLNTTFVKYLDEEISSGRISIKMDYQLYTTTTSNSTKPLIIKDSTGKIVMEKTVRGDEGNIPNPGKMNWSELEVVIDLDNKVYDLYTDGNCIFFNQPYDSTSATGVMSIGGATPSGAQSSNSNSECSTIYDNFVISVMGDGVEEIDNTPTNVKATNVGKTELTLTWSEVENATSYNVYEVNEDKYTLIGSTATTSYRVAELLSSTTYKFAVSAIVDEEESDKSSIVTVKTTDDNAFDNWKRIISGSSTNLEKNSFIDEADGSVTIESLDNKGKISANNLGTAFQYGEVLASDNFTLKTNAVASIFPGESQQSFGIMLRDENGTHGSSSAVNANFIGVGAIGGAQNEVGNFYRVLDGNIIRNTTKITPATNKNYEFTLKKEGDLIRITLDDGFESGSLVYDVVDLGLFTDLDKTLFVGMYTARTATVNYSDFSLDIETKSPISDLTIESMPNKVTYFIDDDFEKDGIVVRATFEDGSSRIIEDDFLKFEGFDSSKISNNTMKVLYGGKEVSFNYEVVELKLLEMDVKYSPSKTKYFIGDSLNTSGLVIEGLYNSGNKGIINENDYTVSGFDSTKTGEQVITVTFKENTNITTSFVVNVVNADITGISVSKMPNKTYYFLNEELDLRGMEIVTLGHKITLDESDYKVSDFDSKTAGVKTITIEYKGFTTSFFVKVDERSFVELLVTKYPLTTISVGENLDLTGIEISRVFDNGDVEPISSDEYYVDSSKVDRNTVGVYEVDVILLEDESSKVSFNVSVRAKGDQIWKTAIFGQSSNISSNFFKPEGGSRVNSLEDGKFQEGMSVIALDGGGKITASHDGMSFYYTELDGLTDNFVISADVIVNEFGKPSLDNQEAFGLVARDIVGEYTSGTQPINASNMVYIGGYRGLTQGTIRKGVGVNGDLSQLSIRATDLDNGTRPTSSNTGIGNYKLTLSKTNSGFYLQLNDDEPVFYAEPDILTVQDNKMYVGFFTARLADITIKNLEMTITDAETDAPKTEQPEEVITPAINVVSLNTTSTSEYDLKVIANVDGKLIAVDDNQNEVVVEDVKANVENALNFTLGKESTNFTITFTPDSGQNLSSYNKIVKYFTVTKKDFEILGDKIFVSPTGIATATGERENPLDLVTAINFVKAGQSIVMLEGTYVATDVLNIPKGNNGTSSNYKSLVADKDAKVIIDMNAKGNFNISGNYWHLYGIDVTNATGGLRIGGSHNIIELVNTYNNGDTGLQISRTDITQTDISVWPSYNLILNCTSYNNRDSSDNNADGFAAKLTSGVGNVFRGCISHNNVDDGWDLYAKSETGAIGAVLLDGCIAYNNGTMLDGTVGNGDKNGFKLGGEGIPVKHTITNSIAFGNGADGFTSNSNPDVIAYNNISYNNKRNLNFYTASGGTPNFVVENFISYNGPITSTSDSIQGMSAKESVYLYSTSSKKSVNSEGVEVTDSTFVSLTPQEFYERDENGNIIFGEFLQLSNNFDSIDDTSNKVNNLKIFQLNNEELRVRWDGVAGATGYEVYYKTDDMSDFELYKTALIGETVFAKINGVDKYDFKVRAIVPDGFTEYSDVVTSQFSTITIDEATNIDVTVIDSETSVYKISWDKVEGGLSYIVSIRKDGETIFTTRTIKSELLTFINGFGEFEITVETLGENNISSIATYKFTVEKPDNLVKNITITGSDTVTVGSKSSYKAVVTPSEASEKVKWSIDSGENFATINDDGILNSFSVGEVVIRATAVDGSDVFGTFNVTVSILETTSLENAIAQGNVLVENEQYTKSSRNLLEGVINSINNELTTNDTLNKSRLDELELLINEAINELVVISVVDKNNVIALISDAEEIINSHQYMDNNIENLINIVNSAKAYIESHETSLLVELAELLQVSMDKVVAIPLDINATDENLNVLLNRADGYIASRDRYSVESIINLENTLNDIRNWQPVGASTLQATIFIPIVEEDETFEEIQEVESLSIGISIAVLSDALDMMEAMVDKSELNNSIIKADAVDLSVYSENTSTELSNKKDNAVNVLNDENATNEQVVWAKAELDNAYNNLVKINEFRDLVEEALNIDTNIYTFETVDALEVKLLSSEILLENSFATTNIVEKWVAKLKELLSLLEKEEIVNVDKTLLESIIKEANEYKSEGYTADSWSEFSNALNKAYEVQGNETATTLEVSTAVIELSNAINNLRADKTMLESAIAKAYALKSGDYTSSTWSDLTRALDKANIVNDNEMATVAQVLDAIKLIEDSIKNLKKVDSNTGAGTSGNGNPITIITPERNEDDRLSSEFETEEIVEVMPEEVVTIDEGEVPLGTAIEDVEDGELDRLLSLVQKYSDYKDVSSFAEISFAKAIDLGFIVGYDGKLNPKGDVTRAEFLTMLIALQGIEIDDNYKGVFTDVEESDWFAGIVEKGYELGYIQGVGNGKFAPNANISKQDMMIIFNNMLNLVDVEISTENEGVSQYASQAYANINASGIMPDAGKAFAPKENVTRELAVTLLINFYEMANDNI